MFFRPLSLFPRIFFADSQQILTFAPTLVVLCLFWLLRRALKYLNAKTAYAEPKTVMPVMVEPTEAGIGWERESLYIERRLLRRLFLTL